MFTKADALADINETQDFYAQELADIITGQNTSYSILKEIDFTSPTGTGKTVMLAKLINLLPDFFFFVTTLSRGQLCVQVENKLNAFANQPNYIVFGLNEYTRASRLKEEDIVSLLPQDKKVVWVRDEGHIATNRWAEVLYQKAFAIINVSATNRMNNGVQCNFMHTMMLRTVSQSTGSYEQALDKLLEVKRVHQSVSGYNPCALFRVLDSNVSALIAEECDRRGLKCINITDETFDMEELCSDDNDYDVIINKYKITEGIDLRRCHVIYMDTKPTNEATVVQTIGRARRNALFWRTDIDILAPKMKSLLKETRKCFVYYNVPETELEVDENGELAYSLCDTVSVESLRPGIEINVKDGQLPNGLYLLELAGKTGVFKISKDPGTGFNVAENPSYYETEKKNNSNSFLVDVSHDNLTVLRFCLKPNILDFFGDGRYIATDWSVDYHKSFFYYLCLYAKKTNRFFDCDYWASFLQVDNKCDKVDDLLFWRFRINPQVSELIREYEANKPEFTQEEKDAAEAFSKRTFSDGGLEKRGYLSKAYTYRFAFISANLLHYAEYVESYDTTLPNRIAIALGKINGRQIDKDKFKVTNHPLSYRFPKRALKSFNSFRRAVFSCKEPVLIEKPVDYWKEAINHVGSFEELDDYDSRVVDLRELNDLAGINLSDEDIDAYLAGTLPIKKFTAEEARELEVYCIRDGMLVPVPKLDKYFYRRMFLKKYVPYIKTINDKETAIIGADTMKYIAGNYIEDRAVTSKISKHSKFRQFITKRYHGIIEMVGDKTFAGQNRFSFGKKCNSCLGYCVEFFAKIKLYGDDYYKPYIDEALQEANTTQLDDLIRVRAAMIIYRELMSSCYGKGVFSAIPTIQYATLQKTEYAEFAAKVIELGLRTKEFVAKTLYGGAVPEGYNMHDPDLSVRHIAALCDFITEDTILEVKCTSSITMQHVLQLLAYYYLSGKRTDLKISRLVIYEAVTDNYLEIDMHSLDDIDFQIIDG